MFVITKPQSNSYKILKCCHKVKHNHRTAFLSISADKNKSIFPVKMSYNSYESRESQGFPPLLIMHGLFGSKSNWNSMSKALHNNIFRKVIAVDARNHGETQHSDDFSYWHLTIDIKHFMDEQNLENSALMGHSMGGRAMMLFALNYPELVEKLIVVDISPLQHNPELIKMGNYFKYLSNVTLPNDVPLSEARKQANELLSTNIPDKDIREFLLTNLTPSDSGGFKWRVNINSLSKNFQQNIMKFPKVQSTCDRPTLFIGGMRSDYLKPTDEPKILELFPNAEFIYLDTSHWVHAEKPAEFIEVVSDFLKKNIKI